MEIYIAEHCKSLAESCILGLIFGAGYDIICILYVLLGIHLPVTENGVSVRHGKGAFCLFLMGDLAYMLAVTIGASVFLYHSNYGQFRLFLLLGCLAGFRVYQKTLGKLVMAAAVPIVRWLKIAAAVLVFRPAGRIISAVGRLTVFLVRCTTGRIRICVRRIVCGHRMRSCMKRFPEFVKLQKV